MEKEVNAQIQQYIESHVEPKRGDMETLHNLILSKMPNTQLWFLDGKDAQQKTVSNPNIGYGNHKITYKDGSSKPFYNIGLSSNSTGISIYFFGFNDKKYLPDHFSKTIGKANVSGYCIKFKKLKDIDLTILGNVIISCITNQSKKI